MKIPDFGTLTAKLSSSEGRRERKPSSFTQEGYSRDNVMSTKEHVELVLSRIEARRIDITQDHKDWVSCLLALASTFGEDGRDYAHRVSQFWLGNGKSYSADDVDEKYDWCLANGQSKITIATFMGIAKDNGVDVSMPEGRYPEGMTQSVAMTTSKRPRSEKARKEEVNMVQKTQEYLNQIVELRYNQLSECIEVRNHILGTPWVRLDDRIHSTLLTQLHQNGIMIKSGVLVEYLNSEIFAPCYNPATAYLDALPAWDPSQPDYIKEFIEHVQFDCQEGKTDFYYKYFKKWFLNFVALMSGTITSNQIMLNFLGTQNVGKTYFCKHILPPELRDYFHTIHPNEPLDKDQLLSLSGFLLILLDELTISAKNSNAFKAMLSTDTTEIRGAYARHAKKRVRKASFVATGNDDIYISDAQGSRRYVSLKVISTVNLNEHPLPYEGAYAQAKYLIAQPDFHHNLTSDEVKELDDINQSHTEPDIVSEAICSLYRIPGPEEKGKKINCADIFANVTNKYRIYNLSSREIGITMTKLGFAKSCAKGKSRYYVMEINPDEYDNLCDEEGEEYFNQLHAEACSNEQKEYASNDDIFKSAAVDDLYNGKDEDDYEDYR